MIFGDLAHDGEPQPRAPFLGGKAGLEEALPVVLLNAGAVVLHLDAQRSAPFHQAHPDGTLRAHRGHGVVHQIDEGALHHVAIPAHRHRMLRESPGPLDLRMRGAIERRGLADEIAGVQVHELGRGEPRETAEGIHQFREAGDLHEDGFGAFLDDFWIQTVLFHPAQQPLGRELDGREGILHLVSHAARHLLPRRAFFRLGQQGQILQHRQGPAAHQGRHDGPHQTAPTFTAQAHFLLMAPARFLGLPQQFRQPPEALLLSPLGAIVLVRIEALQAQPAPRGGIHQAQLPRFVPTQDTHRQGFQQLPEIGALQIEARALGLDGGAIGFQIRSHEVESAGEKSQFVFAFFVQPHVQIPGAHALGGLGQGSDGFRQGAGDGEAGPHRREQREHRQKQKRALRQRFQHAPGLAHLEGFRRALLQTLDAFNQGTGHEDSRHHGFPGMFDGF